jgi:hypothetical protein
MYLKQSIIKNILLEMLEKKVQIRIQFDNIGKNAYAHKVGYKVFKSKQKAGKILIMQL